MPHQARLQRGALAGASMGPAGRPATVGTPRQSAQLLPETALQHQPVLQTAELAGQRISTLAAPPALAGMPQRSVGRRRQATTPYPFPPMPSAELAALYLSALEFRAAARRRRRAAVQRPEPYKYRRV